MKKLYSSAILSLFSLSLMAQQSIGGTPLSFILDEVNSQEYEIAEFDSPDMDQIIEEDSQRDLDGQLELISRLIESDLSIATHGTWETLENNDRIWRLKVTSRDALALNFIYNDFHLADNSVLHVYSADTAMVLGGFTSANNKEIGIFATGNVHGESVVLELFEPASDYAQNQFTISQIGYVYRHAYAEVEGAFRGSDDCQVNVACSEGTDWEDEEKGAVRILLTSTQGQGWCSGSLINNTALDCKPYILTAWHCGVDSTPNQYASYIYYFNYQANSCTASNSPGTQSITGSDRIAYSNDGGGNNGSDFLLTELTQDIPSSINAYWNGWNANTSPSTSGSGGVSIHHPSGDIKKISTYTSALQSTTWGGTPGTHWRVFWSQTENGHGVTEGGSSGSPIFNSEGLIVGQLTGGSSFCSATGNPDLYGKMSYNWDSNGNQEFEELKNFLDPTDSGVLELTGTYAPCNDPTVFGCMDPEALNYNPEAEVDDGSCEYPCEGSDLFVDLTLDCYGAETGWTITDDFGNVVYEVEAGTYPGAEGSAVAGGSMDMLSLCLDAGCYTITLTDTFGDGFFGSQWQNCSVDGDLVLTDALDNVLVDLTDPDFGTEVSFDFCLTELDVDGDGFLISEGDCNNNNPDVYPGATEICDGIDNNCNDLVDEGFVINVYYLDADDDGYGTPEEMIQSCFQPDGYSNNDNDCDDSNPDVNPGMAESCNGVDDNCNDETDEGFDLFMWYLDSDDDGYGNPNVTTLSCFLPDGYADNPDDCNDVNGNINPGASEICNNADDDCSGVADDNIATQIYYEDADDDNYGNPDVSVEDCAQPSGYVQNDLDCDDSDDSINPAASEIMDDGIDQDCDGEDLMTGIEELGLGNIDIYPNPANSLVTVHFEIPTSVNLEIYDTTGRLVYEKQIVNQTESILDVSSISSGAYFMRFTFDQLTSVKSLIIE